MKKIRIKKDVVVDMKELNAPDFWNKHLKKWEEFEIDFFSPEENGKSAHIVMADENVLFFVPRDSFEEI